MNPEDYPEAAPLHVGRYDWFPVQSRTSTMVQYTTVNITTEPPRDHIIWSLCSLVYFNPLCLGLAALIYSVKARDRKVVGDLEGARHYGSTACYINIISTVLTSIIILVLLIMFSQVIIYLKMLNNH